VDKDRGDLGRVSPARVEAVADRGPELSVTTWNREHHRWPATQQFRFESTELAFIDLLAAVHGLAARCEVLDQRLSRASRRISGCGRRSPGCARSKALTLDRVVSAP
jgi:hypothetical protein